MSNLLFQTTYKANQDQAFEGQLGAQPGHIIIPGLVGIPTSNGITPRPGYQVYFNTSTDRWEVPNSAALQTQRHGILVRRVSDIVDDDGVVEYEADTIVDILIRGTVWVKAGTTIKQMQEAIWNHTDRDWDVGGAPQLASVNDVATITSAIGTVNSAGVLSAINAGLSNVDDRIDALEANINTVIGTFGYTRLTNLTPGTTNAGELFEVFFSGASIL